MLMLFLRKCTEPSAKSMLAPPGCRLAKPLAEAAYRQPSGALAPCQLPLHAGSLAGKELESQPSGTVVPEALPVDVQKALFASASGKTSPTMIVLLVPSVTLAMLTICIVE